MSVPSMQRYRQAAGISRKRLTRLTSPKFADPSVVRAVNAAVQRDDVVSIDETAFYVKDCPRYGYALRGKRARLMLEKPVRGVFRRCTVLAALTKRGILDYTVIEGSCNQHSFSAFIQRLDMPSGSVVLMDNAGFHKTKAVDAALRERRFKALFTPPYSPWCNPIELAFSKIKTSFRHAASLHEPLSGDLDTFIGRLTWSVSSIEQTDASGFFLHVARLTSASDVVAALMH